MAIVKMKKVTLIAMQEDKLEIINALQSFGVLHIEKISNQNLAEDLTQIDADVTKTTGIMAGICQWAEVKHPKNKLKRKVDKATYEELLLDRSLLREIEREYESLEKAWKDCSQRETTIQNNQLLLKPWKNYDGKLEDLMDTAHTVIWTGTIPKREVIELRDILEHNLQRGTLQIIGEMGDTAYFIAACHKEEEETFLSLMQNESVNRISFDGLKGSARDCFDNLEKEAVAIKLQEKSLEEERRKMVRHLEYLETLCDVLSVESQRLHITERFMKTNKTFMLNGWIPKELTEALRVVLSKVTPYFYLSLTEPEPAEIYPTLLKNHRYAKPLEFITDQYSVPDSRGLDPNPVMAPFFMIFFGIMASDAIYGLIVAGISAYILKRIQPEGNTKKLIGVLALGGISASFWGIMFGGWFGGLIQLSPILFDPLKEPFKMIALCLTLGVIHLFVGFGLQAYMNIKKGFVVDALLDQGLWVAFLISVMSLALEGLAPFNQYAAIAFALGLVLTQGRRKKNIVLRLLTGVLSLYGITGFLGDVLSYLRLFALGLATGVIGTVINSMAMMLSGSWTGWFFMLIILVVGHTFNIGINVLGAYVHASRLQYVEFFSKFYEGDGIPYAPFRVKTQYIKINEGADEEDSQGKKYFNDEKDSKEEAVK